MAKIFFYVCAGILMLAGAFALGARSVEAQVGDRTIAGVTYSPGTGSIIAITAEGDVYHGESTEPFRWFLRSNVFDGPVSTESESMGDVKSMFR